MEAFQLCSDTSDLRELSTPQQLYLKPEAKISITVALPGIRLPGKVISNWEVMERLRQIAAPDEFQVIKVSKSTLEFIRFDAEIENRSQIKHVIGRLDGKAIRLSGFPEPLKIRAAESKPEHPVRHDWDKYFRDAKNMNEMKPGERPDTIYLQGLPSKWFISKKDKKNGSELPSDFCLQKVFEHFGEIRCVDIPMLDPYRNSMKSSISGIRKFSHTSDATFDAFVQYREYICFVRAMEAICGMKMVHRDGVKAFSASFKVDFDKTKHLSDASIRRRDNEREKLMANEREIMEQKRMQEEQVKQAMADEERKKLEEKRLKGERRKEREEKRKSRILKKLKKKEAEQMNIKIAIEERKLLMAQRKLESIRLLDELFERVKIEKQKQVTRQKEKELENQLTKVKQKKDEKLKKKEIKDIRKKEKLLDKEKELRKKLVKKIMSAQEQRMEERREKLRKTIAGKVMKSVLKTKDGAGVSGGGQEFDFPEYGSFDYRANYDGYSGFGFRDWGGRGGFRGRFFPRRYFRGGYRGGYNSYYDWGPQNPSSDWQATDTTSHSKKDTAGDVEEISSDSESSATSKDLLTSSDENKNKETESTDAWAGAESRQSGEGTGPPPSPWAGYSDYYNPRFMRRGTRRPRGLSRGSWRGYPNAPNPNVPMNSFYMQNINQQYYKYFNRLANGEEAKSRSRSRSVSNERVVCRKVLSRSRSRGKSYSRSDSRSSSRSRSRSKSKDKRSRSRTPEKREEPNRKDEKDGAKKDEDARRDDSDLSLSLSGSDDWTRGSPERKDRPLGDPNWQPMSSSRFLKGRDFYDGPFGRFNREIRSQVARPERSRDLPRRSRSRSHERRRSELGSRQNEDHRSGDREQRRSRERQDRSRDNEDHRSGDRENRRSRERQDRSRDNEDHRSGDRENRRSRERQDRSRDNEDHRSGDRENRRSRERQDRSRDNEDHRSADREKRRSHSREDDHKSSDKNYRKRSRERQEHRSRDVSDRRSGERNDREESSREKKEKSRRSSSRSKEGPTRSKHSKDDVGESSSKKESRRREEKDSAATTSRKREASEESKSKSKKEKKRKKKHHAKKDRSKPPPRSESE